MSRAKARDVTRAIDDSSAELQTKAGKRIEGLARQIRHLGRGVASLQEADALARRLEETADYIRFRPASNAGRDIIQVVKKRPVYLTVVFSLLAGVLAYQYYRRSFDLKS
jgi:hypothetical protein